MKREIQKGAKDLNQPFKKAKTHLSTSCSELIATADKEIASNDGHTATIGDDNTLTVPDDPSNIEIMDVDPEKELGASNYCLHHNCLTHKPLQKIWKWLGVLQYTVSSSPMEYPFSIMMAACAISFHVQLSSARPPLVECTTSKTPRTSHQLPTSSIMLFDALVMRPSRMHSVARQGFDQVLPFSHFLPVKVRHQFSTLTKHTPTLKFSTHA